MITESLPNNNAYFRWTFWILVILGFILLPLLSLDAGTSGDEHLHYQHSLKVLNYYKTLGADKSALDTPGTHLKYYGQLFDNLVTLVAEWFKIEDIYTLRHLANALAGCLIILLSGLLARSIFGYPTAIIVILLFFISPRFIGHSFNNLKDIPFALGYIASLYFSFEFIREWPSPKKKTIVLLILAFAFILGVRIGGMMVFGYLVFFALVYMVWPHQELIKLKPREIARIGIIFGVIFILSWILGLLFWPYGLEHPILHPYKAFLAMSQFPTTLRQIFEGHVIWSDALPWYYLLKYLIISIPPLIFLGLIIHSLNMRMGRMTSSGLFSLFLLFSILFPLVFIILNDSNTYGGWRHILFIYPPMVILSARGLALGLKNRKQKWHVYLMLIIILLGILGPVRFMVRNHPYQYLYFNEFAGGLKGAYGHYETDYYFHGMRKGSEWLANHETIFSGTEDTVIIASNFPIHWWFRNTPKPVKNIPIHYYTRGQKSWDYAVIGNSYIQPHHLTNGAFPPSNTIHAVRADSIPICVVLQRSQSTDYQAYNALQHQAYETAIDLGRTAIFYDPMSVSNYITIAKAYKNLQIYDSAIIALNMALNFYPQYELAYDILGQIYFQTGQMEISKGFFRKALETNYKYFPSYVNMAAVLISEGKADEGVAMLKKCLTLNPEYKSAYDALGRYFLSIGKYDIGQKYLDHSNNLK